MSENVRKDPGQSVAGSSARKRPAPRGTASYPRKRAITACQVCRARRTKCDNLKPKCSFCLKTGANCVQSPLDLSSFDPASLHIIEQLDELKQLIQLGDQKSLTRLHSSQNPVPSNEHSWLFPVQPEALLDPNLLGASASLLSTLKTQDVTSPVSVLPNSPASAVSDPNPRVSEILMDNFFNFVHVKNPILDEEAARRVVRNLTIQGADWSAQSCLAFSILALGSIATAFGPSEGTAPGYPAYATAQFYFEAAQKRIGICLAQNGTLQAQCLFLAGVYMMYIFKPFEAWRMFSQSLTACQNFDFLCHQNILLNAHGDEMWHTDHKSVAEQSIYWSAWKSEQEMRLYLMPHDFSSGRMKDDLYPPFFPTPPSPTSERPEFSGESQAHRENTGWFFYLSEISLRRLQHRLASEMRNQEQHDDESIVAALARTLYIREAQVQEWERALPTNMSMEASLECDDVCKFVLRGHLYDLYEMIYWPFFHVKIISDDEEMDQTPDFVTHLAEKALRLHVDRIGINKPGFMHRHHGTWPMVRTCSRSALALLKAAQRVKSGSTLRLPTNWQTAVQEVIELNRFWSGEAPDARHRLPILEGTLWDLQQSV